MAQTREQIFSNKTNTRFSAEQKGRGTSRFLQRSDLLNLKSDLVPSNALTIICSVWSDELPSAEDGRLVSREAQTEGLADGGAREEHRTHLDMEDESLISSETRTEDLADGGVREEDRTHLDIKGGAILQKHFQDLLSDGSDHDVTLKVKDQQFRAHKCILRARSPVFAAMFAHNMTENERGEVCIEDCDPSAFGEFLKYVYVGKVEDMSPNTATSLYYAADKYDFPDLKYTCVEFLKASLTTNVISDVITLAMNHAEEELLKCAMEFLSKQVVETMKSMEWQRFTESNPSLSNEVIIKAMETSRKSSTE